MCIVTTRNVWTPSQWYPLYSVTNLLPVSVQSLFHPSEELASSCFLYTPQILTPSLSQLQQIFIGKKWGYQKLNPLPSYLWPYKPTTYLSVYSPLLFLLLYQRKQFLFSSFVLFSSHFLHLIAYSYKWAYTFIILFYHVFTILSVSNSFQIGYKHDQAPLTIIFKTSSP